MILFFMLLTETGMARGFEPATIEVTMPANVCGQTIAEATIPARATGDLKFETDATDVFWASVSGQGTRHLEIRVKDDGARSGRNRGLDLIRDDMNDEALMLFKDKSGTRMRRTFTLAITNPSADPVSMLVVTGLTVQSFNLMIGASIPEHCF